MTSPSRGRSRRQHPVQWYTPGELVVAVELPRGRRSAGLHAQLREGFERSVAGRSGGLFAAQQSRQEPIVFSSPDRALGFFFFDLDGEPSHVRVRDAVRELHRADLASAAPRGGRTRPLGVMPHWLSLAQQDCVGGSPGSFPRPVRADELPARAGRWRYRYRAAESALDLASRAESVSPNALVRVAVLDSVPDAKQLAKTAKRVAAVNAQFDDVASLRTDASETPNFDRVAIGLHNTSRTQLGPAYDLSNHGLFISSLIRSTAPRAPVELLPALSSTGVGDLESLLRALSQAVGGKKETDPLVVNLSLGLLPPLERLPFVWYSADLSDDPGHVPDVVTANAGQSTDTEWLRTNSIDVQRSTELLHTGLEHLADILLANNCLVVAAAGNDSLARVEAGRRRLGPRVPACYRSVLGVAATGNDDSRAAAYSNMGDEWNFGDHVATFGGDVDDSDEPVDGVVGVYASDTFPDPRTGRTSRSLPNETGWARWSGTSFATGLISGLAANLWSVQRARAGEPPNAAAILGQLASEAAGFSAALGTRSIPMQGRWEQA